MCRLGVVTWEDRLPRGRTVSEESEVREGLDRLRDVMEQSVPLVRHLGIEVVEVGDGRGVARLPDDPALGNHVGTQHAGSLFTVAETASGAAMIGAFSVVGVAGSAVALVRSATIRYSRPARGVITATAVLDEGARAAVGSLVAEPKADFVVEVVMHDDSGDEVACLSVDWAVRKRTPRA